jgi:hypothetical protein
MYALLPLQNLDSTVLSFSTSSVLLVTDNVTKALQVGIQMELTAYWDGNVVSQFQACFIYCFEFFTGGCFFTTQDLLASNHCTD